MFSGKCCADLVTALAHFCGLKLRFSHLLKCKVECFLVHHVEGPGSTRVRVWLRAVA